MKREYSSILKFLAVFVFAMMPLIFFAQEASEEAAEEVVEAATEVAEEAAEEVVEAKKEPITEQDEFLEGLENVIRLKKGQLVKGTIVQITDTDICVNIGYKSDGLIHKSELSAKDEKIIELLDCWKDRRLCWTNRGAYVVSYGVRKCFLAVWRDCVCRFG